MMGFLDEFNNFRANRAKAKEDLLARKNEAAELQRQADANSVEIARLEAQKRKELSDFVNSIVISPESFDSYRMRYGGEVIVVPGNQAGVAIHVTPYRRKMIIGDVEYLRSEGMVALLEAQRQTASSFLGTGVYWSRESVYYGIPVRKMLSEVERGKLRYGIPLK